MDFLMSPTLVNDDDIGANFSENTERLYPHDKSCLLVVVPQETGIQNFMQKIGKNGDVQSICCVLLMFALVRIVIRRANVDEWFTIVFRTLQFCLIQGQILDRNAVEAAWTIILRGFSVIAVSTISAILYKSLINVQPRQIDTVADLVASNLPVCIPDTLSSQLDDLSTK